MTKKNTRKNRARKLWQKQKKKEYKYKQKNVKSFGCTVVFFLMNNCKISVPYSLNPDGRECMSWTAKFWSLEVAMQRSSHNFQNWETGNSGTGVLCCGVMYLFVVVLCLTNPLHSEVCIDSGEVFENCSLHIKKNTFPLEVYIPFMHIV